MKVLYVCPFAHYSGHHPFVTVTETRKLQEMGMDVTLLTFCGVLDNAEMKIRHIQVLPLGKHPILDSLLKKMRRPTLPRWVIMFIETALVLVRAIQVKRRENYDIIHLRDGEPFIFLPFLVSLLFRNFKWAISLTAAIVFKPKLKMSDFIHRPFVCMYSTALYFVVNNRVWKLLYAINLKRNKWVFMPQNENATKAYKEYLGGVFKNNVVCVELGVDPNGILIDKKLAREQLGVPQDEFVALSFGAPHSGKAMDTIFDAISRCPDVYLVHGGTHTFSLGSNPIELTHKYNLDGRTKLFNRYIPEQEHSLFFSAVDVLILSYTKAFASTSSTVWESSKYRLPVISSNANTLGANVKNYGLGLLFEAENAESLAEAIGIYRQLSSSEIDMMKENCGKFVAEYSDTKWAEKCIAVYKRLLDE